MYDLWIIILSLYFLSFCNKVKYSIRLSIIHSRINKFLIDVILTWLFTIQLQKYEFICTFVVLGFEFIFAVELKNVLQIVFFYKPRFIWNHILFKNIYLIVVIWKTGSNMNVCLVLMTLSNYYSHHFTSIHNELLIQRVTIIYS